MTRDDAASCSPSSSGAGAAASSAPPAAPPGSGRGFPIAGYEDLTAAQVAERLDGLSRRRARQVRDHERRNANRKTVLSAVERRLGP